MHSSQLMTIETRLSHTYASQFLKLKMRLHSACQVTPARHQERRYLRTFLPLKVLPAISSVICLRIV